MKILFVSSEVFPFAKTGGLADVIGALPAALAERGHQASVIMPYYKCIKESNFSPQLFKEGLEVDLNFEKRSFNLFILRHKGVDIYFIEKDEYYNRDALYGTPQGDYSDNALRFGFFAAAAIKAVSHIGSQDIIHCNDWQSALIPLYIKRRCKGITELEGTKTLFTIHNMAYQGLFDREVMPALGLDEALFTPDGLEFYGRLNFMKAGIIYADAISTVSEGYSREILTPEFGAGLDGLLRTREKDIYGIVNGVDYGIWDPATDKLIPANYHIDDLSGKEECKRKLLGECGIAFNPRRPLAGMITRFAEQKGIDIIARALGGIIRMGADFVILGFGEEKYNNIISEIASRRRRNMAAFIKFDNALAHRIEAASDIFLMPSRYEPCGLNQLYSLKYGTVPVVRSVGGLKDTVEEFNVKTGKGNGFKFNDASPKALLRAIKRACSVYKNKRLWGALLRNCMSCDYSWNSSAGKYERLYERLCAS